MRREQFGDGAGFPVGENIDRSVSIHVDHEE